ncbi:hypothetical protein JOD55_001432 [Arcanobacterium pluranimalium]|uniref:DUF3040 domain-containing protein n=1 Tax=Arcanobacterium pluranimalium TaxID=108028 RepID=UPI001958F232|nr:DUF3040 domain-containing protein [Arcanobacterium pluranimalium]MBM7825605.1 hypothetical protein [Arcanobacterium pluranimalium]
MMALSDYERRMLEELENQLSGDDPKFAQTLASDEGTVKRLSISPKNLVGGLIIAVLGLGVVLLGVSMEIVALGVLGVVIVFGGLWYLTNGTTQRQVKISSTSLHGSSSTRNSMNFMEKQAQEWLRRRNGDQQ